MACILSYEGRSLEVLLTLLTLRPEAIGRTSGAVFQLVTSIRVTRTLWNGVRTSQGASVGGVDQLIPLDPKGLNNVTVTVSVTVTAVGSLKIGCCHCFGKFEGKRNFNNYNVLNFGFTL